MCCNKFIERLNKQIESICSTLSASADFDELAEIHVGTNGEIYLDEVLLPYSTSNVVRICHKYDEEYEDDSYIRMYFGNGDWLSISLLCDYKAKINGAIYYEKDVVSTYYAITNKKMEQHFSTPKEVFEKINQCAEKAGVWIDVFTEEDEDSEIWFDSNGVLWINNTIRTPYMFEDIDSIVYRNDDIMPEHYVRINFKTDEGYEDIDVYGYWNYRICVSRGKMTRWGVYDAHEEIAHRYQSIIEAKQLGIYKDEYVVLNGVLIRYNGKNTAITIPEGVQSIEEGTFCEAPITSVKCPSTLRSIGKYAFAWCHELQNVELNKGLETIEKSAFFDCKKLKNIDIPVTMQSIGDGAFSRTPFEQQDIFSEKCVDGYVIRNHVLLRYEGNDTDLVIPEDVEIIDEYVFSESQIISVKCPSTLRCIREYSFFKCPNLQEVVLNDGLETIERSAFYDCRSLKNVIIPNTVKSIGLRAFKRTPVEQYILDFKNIGEYNQEHYSEIFKLKNMLKDANIPFEWANTSDIIDVDGYRVLLIPGILDAIQTDTSCGGKENKLEIQGALTREELENDSVLGWLTAEEVFKRFKYCFENGTSIYCDEGK